MTFQDIQTRLANYIFLGNSCVNPLNKDLAFLKDIMPHNAFILEAGAHTGSDTIRMAHAFKNPTIFAFEPEPSAFSKLTKKSRGYKNIHTYELALGEKSELRQLFVSKDRLDASSSLLQQNISHKQLHPDIILDHKIEVCVSTIDSWAVSNNIDHMDFMWLDMQGNELSALKSASKILSTVKAVYTEVLISPTYKNAPLLPEFVQWMDNEGFEVKVKKEQYDEQVNILFVKK